MNNLIVCALNSKVVFQEENELIHDLGPLLEPESVLFSMDTIGWKISFVILSMTILLVSIRMLYTYRQNFYRRAAVGELFTYKNTLSNTAVLTHANIILKKIAIQIYGRDQVALLYGSSWLEFLDSKCTSTKFISKKDIFEKASYGISEIEASELQDIILLTENWIKKHAR